MPLTLIKRHELAAAYIEAIGYDPFEDDPSISPHEVAEILREIAIELAKD